MTHRLMAKGGVDMEALSPRDANVRQTVTKAKAMDVKTKPTAQLRVSKEKDHPPPPPENVLEPASVDRPEGAVYHVGKILGKGGFAICYQGYLLPTRHKYALKIVKSQMPSRMLQKFQTELQIHSKMRNKNIVQFHRAFSYENCTYLVLELCPNGSLMDMVKRRKGLTEPEVRFYSVQIAGAIKYMHDKGIIHRDLKMGNIFLDRDMNAKVGDFGLAALLVTGKDMHTIRRTTLCGTPNYIAPEILEKGKKGHDHMVDIWSLGIIMFAMLTSKPPFQSTSTEEIYRRARERDYEWPSSETSQKYISMEAKDIVASMLEDADRRPDPDTIVQHPFFTSGYMPVDTEITPRLLTQPPDASHFYTTRMDTRLRAASILNLKDMCNECGVGPWSQHQVILTQTWKEMAAEEKAGLTPAIPLATDVVYRPFDQWLREQKQQQQQPGVLGHSLLRSQGRPEPHLAASQTAPTGLMRAPPQSFAAQQRAQGRPAGLSNTARVRTQPESNSQAAQTVRQGTVRQYTESEPEPPEHPTRPLELRPQRTSSVRKASLPKAQSSLAVSSHGSSSASRTAMTVPNNAPRGPQLTSLFSPSEHPVPVSSSQPDVILDRLRRLQAELERALNARTMAIISAKDKTPSHPHVVVKWVDYSNKFGLGYILNNGSVGCVLRDIPTTDSGKLSMLPSACMFVRNAERHIERRQDEKYSERHQPLPPNEQVHFFERNGEAGLNRVSVPASQFRVPVNEDGTAGRLNPGTNVYEHRKRERVILWKKFANYMIAYGRDEPVPSEDNTTDQHPTPETEDIQPDDLVTFYQRIGDVGCWVFCDGHLQFNFPDHTKVVLNSTGTWCHFWHLPQEAALHLAENGTLTPTALDERAMLSYPLQTLLNFQTKPSTTRSTRSSTTTRRRPEIAPELQCIPAANDFRRKIEFIKTVVKEWVSNGGLGNSDMSREGRLRWTGYRDTVNAPNPAKMVWVTVGARWGDKRRSAYVDPRNPSELGEEIDESKRKERTQSAR
ncbi:hypothetical protein ACRALDRAFT_1049301 [Sodiomyces alcalophilus JCM 7366]|uniref:uncharacterized protein n=1 Tax=Sodiomyces alcalophilus JCM 7366 TaxID=591952 RepID=UPI0039B51A67